MFDIQFFQKVDALKRKIVSGTVLIPDTTALFDQFEELRSRDIHVFNVETTNYCNMRCVMCPRTTMMDRSVQWIDDALFEKIIQQIVAHKPEKLAEFWDFIKSRYNIGAEEQSENHFYFHIVAKCLLLHGYGEPLLDRKIVERVKVCAHHGLPTYFSCVPANINLEKIQTLMEHGLSILKFSMDAITNEEQKAIRGKHNNFSDSFRKIQGVLDIKERLGLDTKIIITMIELKDNAEQQRIKKQFDDLWENKDVYYYIKSMDNKWYAKSKDPGKDRSHYSQQYCEFPWISLTVMSNGAVVPCTQDYNAEMVFGNAKHQSLQEIWNGEQFQAFRRWHMIGNFPRGYKCNERCDQKKLYQYIQKDTNDEQEGN